MANLTTVIEDHGSRWQISLVQGHTRLSGVGVVKRQMQIGSTRVNLGGIAGLWTHADHRNKGYASAMMQEALALMERQGFEMSLLFGIKDFYHRYGYGVAFPEQRMTVSAEALRTLKGPLDPRAAKQSDLPPIRKLYSRYNAARSGMNVRGSGWTPRWYMPRLGEGTVRRPGKVLVVCDRRFRVRGFAVFDAQAGRMVVAEVCGVDLPAHASLAAALGRRAQRAQVEQVQFCLPMDDPFINLCIPLGCQVGVSYPHNSGAMGRIVLLDPLFKALQPLLESRVRSAGLSCSLEIGTDIGRVALRLGPEGNSPFPRGNRSRIKLGQQALMQLVMGYRRAADMARDPGVSMPGRLIPVLDVLFPGGNPYMWWTDRF